MKRPTLLLADDHALVAEGLRKLLEPKFALLDTVHDGRALVATALRLKPDVILIDISLPLLNGIEAARRIRKDWPQARLLFVTMHTDTAYATEAFRAGAAGYVLKHAAAAELVSAIREVLAGRRYITPSLAERLQSSSQRDLSGAAGLTNRELEVLQLVAGGSSAKEIGAALYVTAKTVEFHKSNIMRKLGLFTIAELTTYAIRHGIVIP